MAREFRLSLVVNLPEDDFEEAAALMALRPIVEELREGMKLGFSGHALNYSVVAPKPRADKGDPAAQFVVLGGKLPE